MRKVEVHVKIVNESGYRTDEVATVSVKRVIPGTDNLMDALTEVLSDVRAECGRSYGSFERAEVAQSGQEALTSGD